MGHFYRDSRPQKHQITLANPRFRRSWWPALAPRRTSAAARLLTSWVRIPPGAWMSVCCECCVLSGRGLCDELITRPEESYRPWCVVVCDLETSCMRRPWPAMGRRANKQITNFFHRIIKHVIWLQNSYVLPDKYLLLTTTTLSVEILGQKRSA